MRVIVKIGGAQLAGRAERMQLARSVLGARSAGHEIVLVHGGGDQIRALTRRLGIEDRYHAGLRLTDAPTAEAVLFVLGGQVNRTLVRSLEAAGVPAVGLTGADGSTFSARRIASDGVDLGFVGEVAEVRPALVESLLAAGYVPVLATIAPRDPGDDGGGADEPFYNINADMGAGPLACALAADALVFLTDVPGVRDETGATLARLTPEDCDELVARGAIRGGMLPKIQAARAALAECPQAHVAIAPAAGEGALVAALESRSGTLVTSSANAGVSHG